jgi:uncharacterized protein YukE
VPNFNLNLIIIAVFLCFVILLVVLIFLINFLARLKWEISYLKETLEPWGRNIEKQQKALETIGTTLQLIEARYIETKRLGDLYTSLMSELPSAMERYQKIMQKLRDETLVEIEQAKAAEDEELKRFKEKELASLEAKSQLMNDLPKLTSQLQDILKPINERLKLFAERGKYPTLPLLSFQARYGRTLLASMGERTPFSITEKTPSKLPDNDKPDQGKKEKEPDKK